MSRLWIENIIILNTTEILKLYKVRFTIQAVCLAVWAPLVVLRVNVPTRTCDARAAKHRKYIFSTILLRAQQLFENV